MPPKKGILRKGPQGQRVKASVRFDNEVGESFTKEEINQIVTAHKDIVDRLNKYLPEGQKLTVDPDLEKKLHDPKLARMYHLGKEIKERADKQREINDQMRSKYGSVKNVEFSITGSYRIGGTKEDQEYNEGLYKAFKENPQKFIYKQYKNVLNTSGKELYELGNDPIKLAEYNLKNYEKSFYAAAIAGDVNKAGNKNVFTDEFKANAKSVGSLAYNITQTKYAVKDFDTINKIAFPSLTEQQIEKITNTSFSYENRDLEDVSNLITAQKYGWKEATPKENFDKIKEVTGVDLSQKENFATSVVFYDKQGNVMNTSEIIKPKNEQIFGKAQEVTDPVQKRDFRGITNNFKQAYMNNWREAFNEKMGLKGNKIDINALEEKNNGSFLQRMFRRPSKEYKAMMEAFKEYNNPESKNYMNKEHLNSATQAYVDHKNEKGKTGTKADRDRMEFANNILKTNKEADQLYKDTENAMADVEVVVPNKKRVTFLLPDDVSVEIVTKKKESVVVKVNEGPTQEQNKDKETEIEL